MRRSVANMPADLTRIRLDDSRDVRYWCRRLSCTQSELRAAVRVLGPVPTDVERFLKRQAANT
jgi:hypothetical protein